MSRFAIHASNLLDHLSIEGAALEAKKLQTAGGQRVHLLAGRRITLTVRPSRIRAKELLTALSPTLISRSLVAHGKVDTHTPAPAGHDAMGIGCAPARAFVE
ncbi:hypothetical protein VEE57_45270 (plasmid) [Escherichia coli]|nr:hypothetical protein VEE57_45270 [Escherichia coli]